MKYLKFCPHCSIPISNIENISHYCQNCNTDFRKEQVEFEDIEFYGNDIVPEVKPTTYINRKESEWIEKLYESLTHMYNTLFDEMSDYDKKAIGDLLYDVQNRNIP